MGVLGARKLEQTTAASESRSDYLLSKRDNVPLSSVFGSGRGKPEKERENARRYLISKSCMFHGREIYQGKYRWPRFGDGQTDFGPGRQTFERTSRELLVLILPSNPLVIYWRLQRSYVRLLLGAI